MSKSPLEFYEQVFRIKNPYSHQIAAWNKFESAQFPLLIKAPSGSGKTEAVIAPFLNQFIDNNFYIAPRMIYVLPMRVLSNSLGDRIRRYANAISPNILVKTHHGDHPVAPFFIADIVVTTLDQFLYGFTRVSQQVGHHIDVPLGSIASSVVVFDEAHMYRDEFTFSVMRALMEILYYSKIPFILMTATMPESLEKSLFENIPLDDTKKILGNVNLNTHLDIALTDEPLVKGNDVNISDELLKKIRNKKTLIVLNQVGRAQRVYEEIKKRLDLKNDEIVLLHSRFTRLDRESHEKTALTILPKKEAGNTVVPETVGIVVSTQVLEAGIDFSAELLLTELAPADSLVQRAGRCARYSGEKGEMIIFPVEGEKGHLPYEKSSLSKTMDYIKNNKINIKDFHQVCKFVNSTLNYKANDFEAADTLVDLYECILYADQKPENIQIRSHKAANVIIVEPKIGKKKRENKEVQIENGIKEIFKTGKIGDYSFDIDINVLLGWFKSELVRYELVWERVENKEKAIFSIKDLLGKNKKQPVKSVSKIKPFGTYIVEKIHYDQDTGVKKDGGFFV